MVDLGKARAQGYQPGWLISMLLDGRRPVSVTAWIRSGNGRATVDVEKVAISGVEIDGRTLDFLILTARVIRYLGEAYLALKLGQDAEGFLRHNLWTLTGVAIGMAMVLVFLIRWMDRRQEMA